MSLFDQKWRKFLSRIWLFKFIPFVDFVLASGSLATGNMNENSDFDVIVGVRQGRIFTARAFCIVTFGLLGWRRFGSSHKSSVTGQKSAVANKVCFNHFVTPAAYRLSEPHNDYWKKLYLSLVPVVGEEILIQKFFDANQDWLDERRILISDARHIGRSRGFAKLLGEWIFSGSFGDWLEQKLKTIQIKRIEKSLLRTDQYKPRIIYNDNELEFHPHTKRIEDRLH